VTPRSGESWFSHKYEDEFFVIDVYREAPAPGPRVLDPTRFSLRAALRFVRRIAPALLVKPAQEHGVAVIGPCLVLRNALCFREVEILVVSPSVSQTEQFKVTCVSDGDTIKVRDASDEMTIRLVGIDAPEISGRKHEPGQPFS